MSDPKPETKPKEFRKPADFKSFRIIGVELREAVRFGAKEARRFHLDGTPSAQMAAAGLQGASADATVGEFAWATYGLSVVASGRLRGGVQEPFVIVIALGPGDRVMLAPPVEA